MKFFRIFTGSAAVTVLTSASVFAQGPGWPRKLDRPADTMIIYQLQVAAGT